MGDSIREVLGCMAQGFRDALVGTFKIRQIDAAIESTRPTDSSSDQPMSTLARRRAGKIKPHTGKKDNEPKVMKRVTQCCAWNGGVFLLSILVFDGVVVPGLQFLTMLIFGGSASHSAVWSWIGPMLTWTFSALWILPLFVLSKVINSFWFQDIADAAYRKVRGRPQLLPSLSKIIADILFSILLQTVFLVQAMLASMLPIPSLGNLVSLLHMCLLYSLYAFEYKWFNMGWEVHKRLRYIETHWPYFVGFGLPLAYLTSAFQSTMISGCIFSIVFPLLIISANEAELTQQPCEFPLRLFSPSVAVANAIFRHSVRKSHKTVISGQTSQSSSPQKQPSAAHSDR